MKNLLLFILLLLCCVASAPLLAQDDCKPAGPTFSTNINGLRLPDPPAGVYDYNENGMGVALVDGDRETFLFGGISASLAREGILNRNVNLMGGVVDPCGAVQSSLPLASPDGEPQNWQDFKLYDIRFLGRPGVDFLKVGTIRRSSLSAEIGLAFTDATGVVSRMEDISQTDDREETVHEAVIVSDLLYITGTVRQRAGSGAFFRQGFITRYDFGSSTSSTRYFQLGRNTDSEAITVAQRRLWVTGGVDGRAFIAEFDLNLRHENTNLYDLDANGDTSERGLTINEDRNGDIVVFGEWSRGGFAGQTSRVFLLKVPGVFNECPNRPHLNLLLDFAGGNETPVDAVIQDDEYYLTGVARKPTIAASGQVPDDRVFLARFRDNGRLEVAHTYEAQQVNQLVLFKRSPVMVGTQFHPGPRGDFGPTALRDLWVARTDADGKIHDCECYTELPWDTDEPEYIIECPRPETDEFEHKPVSLLISKAEVPGPQEYCGEPCPPEPTGCLVEVNATKTLDPTDLCCYDLSLFIDPVHVDEFTRIELKPLGGGGLDPLTSIDPQYSLASNTSSLISLLSNTGNLCNGLDRYFPTGTLPSVEVCVDGFSTNMPQVTVDFIKCDGEVCSDTLTLDCSPCIEIVNDTIYCEGGDVKYRFDFQNTWNQPIKRLAVNNLAPAGATITPDTLFFPAGIPVGAFAGAQVVCVSNATAPDSLKLDFKALGDDDCCFCISNEICQPIPVCCDTCESIEYLISDTIINGEECCYTLDFDLCTEDFFTALRLTALNGVTLSQQSAGTGWSMYAPAFSGSATQTWFPRPTPIHATNVPTGPTTGKVNFCLGNYDGGPLPQVVRLEWLAGSDQNVVCTDSLFFECARPSADSTCAAVVDADWDCGPNGEYLLDLDVQINWMNTAYEIFIDSFTSIPAGVVVNPDPATVNGVFPSGSIVSIPTLTVNNLNPGDSLCFDIALADTILQGQYTRECCYVEVCLVAPECPGGGDPDCAELGLPVYDHDYLGWAGVTCFSGFVNPTNPQSGIDANNYVMGLIDVRNHNAATRGSNWGPPMQHFPAFRSDTLGQIFGLAVDEGGCMYVTATSLYGNATSGVLNFNWGVAGPGGVYQLCPDAAGVYTLTAHTSLPNAGSGLGQVTYDPIHGQLFVSNFSDGQIYRLDATTLATLGATYDFPGYATAAPATKPDFVPLGERVWAVEYNPFDGKLYFSVWGEDDRNAGATATNQLWAIDIDPGTGDFSGTASYVLDLPGRDFGGNNSTQRTAPISDLAFSKRGRMLVTERTMNDEWVSQPWVNWPAHGSRTYLYDWNGTGWVNPQLQHVGYYPSSGGGSNERANSAGGVDFGYRDGLTGCDSVVWNMGDALTFGNSYGGSFIYGLQGHDLPGNSDNPADPDFVGTNSIFIDLDGSINFTVKTQNGDVEIFRDPCCGETSDPVVDRCDEWETTVLNQGFTITQLGNTNTIQMFPPPVMTASDWWVLNPNCNTPPNRQVRNAGDRSSNLGTNGNYLVCITAYRVIDGDTCSVDFVYDGSIQIGAAASCLPKEEFTALVSQAVKVNRLGSEVVVHAPGLPEAAIVRVDYGDDTEPRDYTPAELPASYFYQQSGAFEVNVEVDEFDANGQLCNSTTTNATQNPDADLIALRLFPNPNRGAFTLAFEQPTPGPLRIEVYDLTGRRVLAREAFAAGGEQRLRIDAGQLAPGSYLLRMAGNGFTAAGKFQLVR